MADLTWTYTVGATVCTFYELVQDDYKQRFDGKYNYTKDVVLGATTAAQNYIDIGAFDVAPMSKRCEFTTNAARDTFYGLQGLTGTLASSNGLSYTATLLSVERIQGAIYPRADAMWEQR